jgi:hypothetical protein
VRRVTDKEEQIGGGEDQWQGFIKQMKKHYDKESEKVKIEFKMQRIAIEMAKISLKEDIKAVEKKVDEKFSLIEDQIKLILAAV